MMTHSELDETILCAWRRELRATAERPWLASLLLLRGNRLFARFAYYYSRLAAAPRKVRRHLSVGIGTTALILALSGSPTPVHANTISVGGACSLVMAIENANDINDGQPNLACAMGNPAGADTIVLAGNTYSYTTTFGLGAALPRITSAITIEANGATIERTGGPDFRLFYIDLDGNLTLNNATVRGGSSDFGGGISNGDTLTLNNSTITGNSATSSGGGIHNSGTATLNNSFINGNFSVGSGGGITASFGGGMTLNNSIVSGNSAASGGGIRNYGSSITLNHSTVSDNSANTAPYSGGTAGGILNDGTVTLNSSTVSNNSAYGGGGIDNRGVATFNNSTISGNAASFSAGGIINSGTATLNNSTVSDNTASSYIGGISHGGYGSAMTLNRTIVSGNIAPATAEIGRSLFFGGTFNSANNNIFGHSGLTNAEAFTNFTPGLTDLIATSDGTHPTPLANILRPLANNGGPTLTHALVPGSPAIDIAPAAACSGAPINGVDQRSAARSFGAGCDSGSVELREIMTVGNPLGPDLSGEQEFNFPSGTVVVIDVNQANGLKVIAVEEMGPSNNHPAATGSPGGSGIFTDNWWHINGNIANGFLVDITLPYANADENSRICKYPGNMGGFGWDCGDETDNELVMGGVRRTDLASFSDWAVGDEVGPTAVSLQNITTNSAPSNGLKVLFTTLLTAISGVLFWVRRQQKEVL